MDNKHKELSQEEQLALKQALLVKELTAMEGWGILKQWLQDQINHSWLDPRSCKSKEELAYQYTVAWGVAQGAESVLEFIDKQLDAVKYLTDKKEGKIINKFAIGKKPVAQE
jgi:hypothetical protein